MGLPPKTVSIGIIPMPGLVDLKRDSLLFDQLVADAGALLVLGVALPEEASLLGWLQELGVIAPLELPQPEELSTAQLSALQETIVRYKSELRPQFEEFSRLLDEREDQDSFPSDHPIVQSAFRAFTTMGREDAAKLRISGYDAVPVFPWWDDNLLIGAEPTRGEVVNHVVLRGIPEPASSVSWEQILEFKRDDRVRHCYRDLRLWIARQQAGDIDVRQLAGEIESAVSRFDLYMKEYRIVRRLGTFESLIRAAATGAVAGMAVDTTAALVATIGMVGVSIRKRRAELSRTELAAPGAELAFISKARERFGA